MIFERSKILAGDEKFTSRISYKVNGIEINYEYFFPSPQIVFYYERPEAKLDYDQIYAELGTNFQFSPQCSFALISYLCNIPNYPLQKIL